MKETYTIDQLYEEILKYRFSDTPLAAELCKRLEQLALQEYNHYACAFAKLYTADTLVTQNLLSDALTTAKDALILMQSHHIDSLLAQVYNLIGIIFILEHDELTAFTYYLKGLDVALRTSNLQMQSILYSNIGIVFSDLNSDRGLTFLVKSKEIRELMMKDPSFQETESTRYNYEVFISNIALSYVHSGAYETALGIVNDFLDTFENRTPLYVQIPFYHVQFVCFHHLNMLSEAYQICLDVINFLQHKHDIHEEFISITQMIQEALSMEFYPEAKQLLDLAMAQFLPEDNPYNSCILYQLYIQYYQKENNYETLLTYYRLFYQAQAKKNENLQADYITAIENKIALNQELTLENYYKQDAKDLEEKSREDALTGLGNRYGLEHFYQEHFALCCRNQQYFALMIIDIDHFKTYNDSLGHIDGDHCIQQVASLIKSSFPENYYCARYGGDEFFIVCHNVPIDKIKESVTKLFDGMHELAIPTSAKGQHPYVTISLGGVCGIPKETDTISKLITIADTALYRVKDSGRDNSLFLPLE